jgi:hypothetical protein
MAAPSRDSTPPASPPEAPAGWKLVPIEPTAAMAEAAVRAYVAWREAEAPNSAFTHSDVYRAMLAASPPEAQPGSQAWVNEQLAAMPEPYPEAQPAEQRKPLTPQQIEQGREAWGGERADFTQGVRFAERAHGIKEQP